MLLNAAGYGSGQRGRQQPFPRFREGPVVRIAAIESWSIAEELALEIGTRIVRINGRRVRDSIDLTFLLAEPAVELETLTPAGATVVYEVERDPEEHVGIVPAPVWVVTGSEVTVALRSL